MKNYRALDYSKIVDEYEKRHGYRYTRTHIKAVYECRYINDDLRLQVHDIVKSVDCTKTDWKSVANAVNALHGTDYRPNTCRWAWLNPDSNQRLYGFLKEVDSEN